MGFWKNFSPGKSISWLRPLQVGMAISQHTTRQVIYTAKGNDFLVSHLLSASAQFKMSQKPKVRVELNETKYLVDKHMASYNRSEIPCIFQHISDSAQKPRELHCQQPSVSCKCQLHDLSDFPCVPTSVAEVSPAPLLPRRLAVQSSAVPRSPAISVQTYTVQLWLLCPLNVPSH